MLRRMVDTMVAHARRELPNECCGLLAGREDVIEEIFEQKNLLNSPSEFEIPPKDLFQAFREFRARGLTHLGIYHSHPASAAYPSDTDRNRAFYPDVAYFIISLSNPEQPDVRAFRIVEGRVTELAIEITEPE